MFTKEDFGKPIPTKLSERLRKYISRTDRAEIAINSNVGVSLITQIVYQSTTLTENSAPAVEQLIQLAITKCKETMSEAQNDVQYFEKLSK